MIKSKSGARKPIYSWDTSVLIAWINEEESAPLGDIALVADEIDQNKAVLVLSVIVIPEVSESKMTSEQIKKFENFCKRSNVIVADTTIAIAKKASRIRDAGAEEGRKIKTPDATILATAIIYGCDVLHSLDNKGSGHLKLNGSPIVDGLKVTPPRSISGQRGIS